jgi:hypothetical protein
MTPAEFRAMAKAKVAQYEQERKDLDALNGMQCYVAAACAGNKDAKPEQFMIFRKQDPPKPQTETEWNNALAAWTGGP